MTIPGAITDPNPPATLDEALARTELSPYFLAEITCGREEAVWALSSGAIYTVNQADRCNGVQVNGAELAAAALGDLATTPGAWAQDSDLIYIRLADDSDPNSLDITVETFLLYRFSDLPTDAGDYFWEPGRVLDLPGLSSRIPDNFKGAVQIGGGTLTLENADRFFSNQPQLVNGVYIPGRLRQNWDAGQAVFYMGCPGLPWDQHLKQGTFSIANSKQADSTFSLMVKEKQIEIDKNYPLNLYTQQDYPLIRQQDIGRCQQLAFGRILDVNPVCVNTVAREFRVAAHPILTFDGVRVKNNDSGLWEDVNFASVDEANALFTLNEADWADGQDLAVDFSGWVRDNGTLADNPSEIALAILQDLQQPCNLDDFEAARLWYDAGYYSGKPERRYTVRKPSLYLDSQNSALDTLTNMMQQVRAYLLVNRDGEFTMKPFRTYRVSELPVINEDTDTVDKGIERVTTDATQTNKVSKVIVTYANRPSKAVQSVVTHEVPRQQYIRGNLNPVILAVDSFFVDKKDADYYAQALATEFAADPATYALKMKWKAFAWTVGQHVRYVAPRRGLDMILEILQTAPALKDRKSSLLLGNLRGYEDVGNFWSLSTDTTPLGADMAWPGGGQVPGDESRYKRQQTGFWHDSKGNATETPLTSADHVVSRWL